MSTNITERNLDSSEKLLGSVDHVQEAVLVPLLLVDLRHGGGHAGQALVVHQ